MSTSLNTIKIVHSTYIKSPSRVNKNRAQRIFETTPVFTHVERPCSCVISFDTYRLCADRVVTPRWNADKQEKKCTQIKLSDFHFWTWHEFNLPISGRITCYVLWFFCHSFCGYRCQVFEVLWEIFWLYNTIQLLQWALMRPWNICFFYKINFIFFFILPQNKGHDRWNNLEQETIITCKTRVVYTTTTGQTTSN